MQRDRPVLHVTDIEPFRFLPRQVGPPADLPQARDARRDLEPPLHMVAVMRGLVRQRRAGADQGHVADDHIDELRELIQ